MKLEVLIVDTNVVSFIMNGHDFGAGYRPHLLGRRPAISFMTVAEMYEGAYRGSWGAERFARLEQEFRKYLIVGYSQAIGQAWGGIRAERRRQPIAGDDAWIAATALALDCPLVTHNPGDFQGIAKLKLISEKAN